MKLNYTRIINYASIFSGILVFADNFLAKEYLHLFLRFSWIASLSFAGLNGYRYYLKRIEDSNTCSYDGIIDSGCPLIIQQKIHSDSFYFVKLGDLEYVFIIVPGEKQAKLLISKKQEGMLKGLSLTIGEEDCELSANEFWYGPIKIIKL